MMPSPCRLLGLLILLFAATMASGCSGFLAGTHLIKKGYNAGGCQTEGDLKVGSPYIVDGITYTPMASSLNYREKGIASWYGDDFHGKATANGECFNMYAFTAAHKTLPLPTIVRVTNLENNKSIIVKVNDRGPFVAGRLIDLSYAAAQSLDIARHGTAPVLVEAIGGPHNYPNGMKDYLAQKGTSPAIPLGPRDQQAETLPSVVPETTQVESLAPLPSFTQRAVDAARSNDIAQSSPVLPPKPIAPQYPQPERADAPPTSTAPLQNTRIFVQLGAFADKTRATAVLNSLRGAKDNAHLDPLTTANGETLWRVRTGPFNSVADGESALARVKAQGFNAAQIKVEKDQ